MYYPIQDLELENLDGLHKTMKIYISQVGSDILHEKIYKRHQQYTRRDGGQEILQ